MQVESDAVLQREGIAVAVFYISTTGICHSPSTFLGANFMLTHNRPHFIFCPFQSGFLSTNG
jgi:hypothetical protein